MQSNSFPRILSIIHLSLLVGLVIFTAFAYWNSPGFTVTNSNDIFIYIVPIVAVMGYFGSKYIFQNSIRNIENVDGLPNRLHSYQTASIIKYSILEIPTVLALIGYYLSGNALHLVVALCLIIYFFSQRPSKKRVIEDLKLSEEEQKLFN